MMADFVTILTSKGPRLSKTWEADGTITGHGRARQHTVRTVPVSNIRELAAVFTELRSQPTSGIVRGEWIGREAEALVPDPEGQREVGYTLRQMQYFQDVAHNWILFDVDGYVPKTADPVKDPEGAVREWIRECLPPEFLEITCYWHLSSSAGHPSKAGTLRTHVAFYMSRKLTSPEAAAYVTMERIPVDRAPLHVIQLNYTADPVFAPGVVDPVPLRAGLLEGLIGDVVDVVIDDGALAVAMVELSRGTMTSGGGEGGAALDPRLKRGLVGAFCRAFTPLDVINAEWFTGSFEQVNDRRLTWLDGNGAKEGAYITEDGQRLVNTHDSSPCNTIGKGLNSFDLVRIYNFGALDDAVPEEDKWVFDSGGRPSEDAMRAFAKSMPEVRAQEGAVQENPFAVVEDAGDEPTPGVPALVVEAKSKIVEDARLAIAAADTEELLREDVCRRIATLEGLAKVDRDMLAVMVQQKFKALTGVRVPIAAARSLLRPPASLAEAEAPAWSREWVWLVDDDCFFSLIHKQKVTKMSFDAAFNRRLVTHDENGKPVVPRASDYALAHWGVRTLAGARYMPGCDPIFQMDGVEYANLYRDDMIPEVPMFYTPDDELAVACVQRHIELTIPNPEYRKLFIESLAYIVRNPGQKLQYAILIKGVEGDGKSVFSRMLANLMGRSNVRMLTPETLTSSTFTGWLEGNCVVVIEELRLHGHSRYEVHDKTKTHITNPYIEVHAKGRDPYSAPNTNNFVAMTNHEDSVPLNDTDRRWFVLFTQWLHISDMMAVVAREFGLTAKEYWKQLWGAVDNHSGALRGWLETVDLSEFDSNAVAPETEFKSTMIVEEAGDEDLAVGDLLASGQHGRGKDGIALGALVARSLEAETGVKPQGRRLNKMLLNHGYRPHPGAVVKIDGKTYRAYTTNAWLKLPIADVAAKLRDTQPAEGVWP